jgi:hypothetical protein
MPLDSAKIVSKAMIWPLLVVNLREGQLTVRMVWQKTVMGLTLAEIARNMNVSTATVWRINIALDL